MPSGVATQTGGKVTRREKRMAAEAFSRMVKQRVLQPRPADAIEAGGALDESHHDMPARGRLARKTK